VSAGFPSPADDYLERDLDLNEYFIRHESATFFVRVSGDSMERAGILDNDVLVVDKSLEPRDGAIVIAVIDGELTVKRLRRRNGEVQLVPENPNYQPITILPEQEFLIWGVVTGVARSFDR
jgi:DNA polymerase V